MAHRLPRSQSGTSPVPHVGARASVTQASCECGARLDICGRHRSVCQVREASCEGVWPRTISWQGVPRSRSNSQDEHVASRHESVRANLRGRSRSWRAGPSTRSGPHTQERCGFTWWCPPKCVSHEQCCRALLEKEHKYHALLVSERCRPLVVAMETGGRWSKEAAKLRTLHHSCAVLRSLVGGDGGPGCWRCSAGGRSRHLWSLLVPQARRSRQAFARLGGVVCGVKLF